METHGVEENAKADVDNIQSLRDFEEERRRFTA
jgi:hypothetical protein